MRNKIIIVIAVLVMIVSISSCRSAYPAAPYHYWRHSGYPRHQHWGAPRRMTIYNRYRSPHRYGHKINHHRGRYRNG